MENRKHNNAICTYVITFIIISLLSFLPFVITGKTFIYQIDALMQHYPFLVKLRHLVGDFVRGEGIALFAQDIGLGSDLIGNLAIVIMDPFNYIAAAFPVEYIDIGYSVAVVLRLFVAGLGMLLFLKGEGLKPEVTVLGGVSYAFSTWAIGSIRHAFFLMPLIILPFLMLGIKKVEKGESPLLLIFSVAVQLVTSLYFSYMTAIFAILFLMVIYIREHTHTVKAFLCYWGRYIGYVCVSIMLAGAVLFPALYTLMNASKEAGGDVSNFLTWKGLFRYFASYIGNIDINGNYSYIGLNFLCIAMLPIIIYRIKHCRSNASYVMTVICLIGAAFPFWGRLMNAMSYPTGRWCYATAFFFVWAACACIEDWKNFQSKELSRIRKWMYGLGILVFITSIVLSILDRMYFCIACINIIGFLMVCKKEFQEKSFRLVYLSICGINMILFSPLSSNALNEYMDIGESYAIYKDSVLKAYIEEEHDFWRVDYSDHIGNKVDETRSHTHTPANEALFYEVPTLTSYVSTIDTHWLEFNKTLGNNAGYYRRMCVYSNDNRVRMDFLEGVKYVYDLKKRNEKIKINEKEYSAGLGFVYDSIIPLSKFETYDYLEKEQILMQGAVVDDEIAKNLDVKQNNNVAIDLKKVDCVPEPKVQNKQFTVTSSNKTVSLDVDMTSEGDYYLVLKNLNKTPFTLEEIYQQRYGNVYHGLYEKMNYYVDNTPYITYDNFACVIYYGNNHKRIIKASHEPQGINDVNDYVVHLGSVDAGVNKVTLSFDSAGKYSYSDISLYCVPRTSYEKQAQQLLKNDIEVISIDNDVIVGEINVENEGILYISQLYNEGWKVYIDDVEVDVFKVNIGFLGTFISEGNHTIRLEYSPVGFKWGLILLPVGVLICILLQSIYNGKRTAMSK